MGFPLVQKLRLPRKLSDFALNFFGEILIAEAVHVGNALAYQLECLGAVKQVKSLFVRQALVFGNEPYDARVFTLEKCYGTVSCRFQHASLPHETYQVLDDVFAGERMQNIIAGDDVVHQYTGLLQASVHIGLAHAQ